MVKITFPDASVQEFKVGVTPAEIAQKIGARLFKDALAAKVNGELFDLDYKIEKDSIIEILTFDQKEGKIGHTLKFKRVKLGKDFEGHSAKEYIVPVALIR